MTHRLLGKTGLKVSVLGFGASALGQVFGTVSRKQGQTTVGSAVDAGINLFDVSPYYGNTLAEERLGEALRGRRHEVVLATKCGRYGVDRFDFSAQAIERGLADSLRRLGTDYVDLLQVHDVEFGNVELLLRETLPALDRLRLAGKARFIGVTGYWPSLLARILEAFPLDTVLNYCHWNLLMNDMDQELTPSTQRYGTGLLNASPLHMGLLGRADDVPDWHPAPQPVRQAANRVIGVCQRYGLSPAAVALRHCMNHPVVASTFVGLRSVNELNDALRALTLAIPAELKAEIDAEVASAFNTWWPSGREENQPQVSYAG